MPAIAILFAGTKNFCSGTRMARYKFLFKVSASRPE
jgi:hypothetical protein